MSKKIIVSGVLSISLFTVIAGVVTLFFQKSISPEIENKTQVVSHELINNGCLKDDEIAKYEIKEKGSYYGDAVITITKKDNNEKRTILIKDTRTSYHPVEIHHCGTYLIREFGVDYKKSEFLEGFNWTLWKYDYRGESIKLLTFAEKIDNNEPKIYYSTDFRVSTPEHHIALIKGYGGSPDYSVVIKDLKTLGDAFVLPVADILKQNPEVVGDVGFENGGWSSDGRYFWFTLNQLADIVGFVRVDSNDWSYKILPAPQRTMGGDAFNINTGMVTYGDNVAPWTGSEEIDQQFKDEAVQNGQISSFYIYNLFSKQKYLVATTTDPTYFFKPFWVSDTGLQYELPDGGKRVYKIKG